MARLGKPGKLVRGLIVMVAVFGVAFLIYSILTPGLASPREQSPRARCSSNMHEIGLAITMYAQDDPLGRFPDNLYTLAMSEGLSPQAFVCPSTHDTPASEPHLKDLTAGGHLSYIYLGAGLTKNSPANAVVLYEPMANHAGMGSNILFADGHAEFFQRGDAMHLSAINQNGTHPIFWPPPPATQR